MISYLTISVSVRLPNEILKRLKERAEEKGIGLSTLISEILQDECGTKAKRQRN